MLTNQVNDTQAHLLTGRSVARKELSTSVVFQSKQHFWASRGFDNFWGPDVETVLGIRIRAVAQSSRTWEIVCWTGVSTWRPCHLYFATRQGEWVTCRVRLTNWVLGYSIWFIDWLLGCKIWLTDYRIWALVYGLIIRIWKLVYWSLKHNISLTEVTISYVVNWLVEYNLWFTNWLL
jgi:hypothetical protein